MTAGGVRVEDGGDVPVVVLDGEVDATVAPGMAARLDEAVQAAAHDAGAVVLDLAGVTFLDSAGVRLVDQLARACSGRSLAWRVVAPRGSAARRVLELVDLVGPEVVEDREAALRSVPGPAAPPPG